MRKLITIELMRRLPSGPCDIWDTKQPGFVVRVRPNGSASYLVSLGRACWHTLGPTSDFAPDEARKLAGGIRGDAAKDRVMGRDPVAERKRKRSEAARATMTLDAFVRDHYEPWAVEHHKLGGDTVRRLRSLFPAFLKLNLTDITAWHVEKYRSTRLRSGARPDTVNSHVTRLKAALTKAVEWKDKTGLTIHPLAEVKPIKTDKNKRVRFLTPEEEARLRTALLSRDADRRSSRERSNAWRRERGYAEWPADNEGHLTPIVMLALNTGLRKGEIFNLQWRDINLVGAQLTVRGEGAKSGQTRYIDLNSEAVDVLTRWRAMKPGENGYVFPGREDDEPLDDIKKAWLSLVRAANIKGFTFHDLRHTFASKLVMAGVDLNTTRELLGHADIKMTLRYAHLAQEHKASAVAKLLSR